MEAKLEAKYIQVLNPRTNKYIKINTTRGTIVGHKTTSGPYKGIKIVSHPTEFSVAARKLEAPDETVIAGKITYNRLLFSFNIKKLRDASYNISKSNSSNLEENITRLNKAIQECANNFHRILISYGDIDPRYIE